MKHILLALLLFCSLPKSFAQAGNDLAAEGLKGRVKMVTETEYSDAAMTRPFMKNIDKYDRKGNLTETTHIDYTLKLISTTFTTFDTATNGAIIVRNESDGKGIPQRSVRYRYDTSGHITEREDHRYYDGKDVVHRSEYYYGQGNKLKEKNFTNGLLDDSTIYTYDNKGRMASAKLNENTGKPYLLTDYFYLSGSEWVYCEKQTGGVRTHVFRTLDTAGLLIEKTTYVSDYSKQTRETNLSFDQYGNWLTQSIKGTITPNYFVARTIAYYK